VSERTTVSAAGQDLHIRQVLSSSLICLRPQLAQVRLQLYSKVPASAEVHSPKQSIWYAWAHIINFPYFGMGQNLAQDSLR
jgi:hypothetical protein